MELFLVDSAAVTASALREAFRPFPEVRVECGDLLACAHNTTVSPANSYGFMDGGIDAAYLRFFGPSIQIKVQEAIARRPEGHLPVGASLVVGTGHPHIRFLIVAPTMVTPEAVAGENVYRAMRAVLRVASSDTEVGRSVFCPGLGTGVGMVSPAVAAAEMARAYADWLGDNERRGPAS